MSPSYIENPQRVMRCGFLGGDADRARTDDLLRDRHFHEICAIVRGCAPGRADVAVMRGCPDLLVCHMCASVRRRGGHLVSNLVSESPDQRFSRTQAASLSKSRSRGTLRAASSALLATESTFSNRFKNSRPSTNSLGSCSIFRVRFRIDPTLAATAGIAPASPWARTASIAAHFVLRPARASTKNGTSR